MCKCKKKRKMQPQVVCESMMSALKKNKVRKRGGACGWRVRLNFSKGQLGKLTERRCALEPGPEQAATQQDESAERERGGRVVRCSGTTRMGCARGREVDEVREAMGASSWEARGHQDLAFSLIGWDPVESLT